MALTILYNAHYLLGLPIPAHTHVSTSLVLEADCFFSLLLPKGQSSYSDLAASDRATSFLDAGKLAFRDAARPRDPDHKQFPGTFAHGPDHRTNCKIGR